MIWTKESLKEDLQKRAATASRFANLALDSGALLAGIVWGAKVPRYDALIARIPTCPYERCKELDELAEHARLIDEAIDPGGGIAKELEAASKRRVILSGLDVAIKAPSILDGADAARRRWCNGICSRCRKELDDFPVRDSRGAFCSAMCASDPGAMPGRGSVSDITNLVFRALDEAAPVVGADRRELLRLVAEHAGVAPVSPRIGSMVAEVKSVADALERVEGALRGRPSNVSGIVHEAAHRLRRAIGLARR